MEPMFTTFLTGAGAVIAVFLIFWVISILIKNPSIIDVCWGIGFIVIAYTFIVNAADWTLRNSILMFVIAIWGLRMAYFVLKRLDFGRLEDHRYVNIRESWKTVIRFHFLIFFLVQAVIVAIVGLPFLFIAFNTAQALSLIEIFGVVICVVATIGEAIADQQLQNFKRNPANKDKICEVGLWNYSRHPNYFFEFLIWAGVFIFALGSPYGWISVISPLLMLHLVLNVTGVRLTEKLSLERRGDAYRRYQQSTSCFIPLPKRKS